MDIQASYYDDDENDDKDVLTQNMDSNGFENVANCNDFDFNAKNTSLNIL